VLTEIDGLLAPGTRREAHHYLAAGPGSEPVPRPRPPRPLR
jgi:hypothetical protein